MKLVLSILFWILGLKIFKFGVKSHVGNCFRSLVIVGGTAFEEKLWRDGTRKKIKMVKK